MSAHEIWKKNWEELLENQLAEDHADDDVTVAVLGRVAEKTVTATLVAKQDGVFAGHGWVNALTAYGLEVLTNPGDGTLFKAGANLVTFRGKLGLCLSIERSFLNTLTHLCGIATLTHAFVNAVKPHPVKVLATRKTLPGLRKFQLFAVGCGGGTIHRRSLSDGVLLKENHLQFLEEPKAISNARAVRSPLHRIEIEVQDLAALDRLDPMPDRVLLDNLDDDSLKAAIARLGGRCEIEVSGGMTLERAGRIAGFGIDSISVGRLTHSSTAIDLSLDFA